MNWAGLHSHVMVFDDPLVARLVAYVIRSISVFVRGGFDSWNIFGTNRVSVCVHLRSKLKKTRVFLQYSAMHILYIKRQSCVSDILPCRARCASLLLTVALS